MTRTARVVMSLDKETFARVQLMGNGIAAAGPFPPNLPFGGAKVHAPEYNPQGARQLLAEQAGRIPTATAMWIRTANR